MGSRRVPTHWWRKLSSESQVCSGKTPGFGGGPQRRTQTLLLSFGSVQLLLPDTEPDSFVLVMTSEIPSKSEHTEEPPGLGIAPPFPGLGGEVQDGRIRTLALSAILTPTFFLTKARPYFPFRGLAGLKVAQNDLLTQTALFFYFQMLSPNGFNFKRALYKNLTVFPRRSY